MRTLTLASTTLAALAAALKRPTRNLAAYREKVRPILDAVRSEGDAALVRFTQQFDGVDLRRLRIPPEESRRALESAPPEFRAALEFARDNIIRFHEKCTQVETRVETRRGVSCRREIRAVQRAGLYVPGGAAPLVSTVLMLGVPAMLAGVESLALCTPPTKDGNVAASILAACALLGIEEIYAVGGAQAIAALAYGTQSIAKVEKIAGPGNAFVTAAKAEVSIDPDGAAIDMLAGPSELLVVADETAEPAFVAADLLSQAEHDANAQIVLLTTSTELLARTQREIEQRLASLPRRDVAAAALQGSVAILVETLDEAVEIANTYAPEHLSIQTARPDEVLATIRNAGSVFLGPYAPEAVGDYCSGTNHVLPTAGTARTQGGVSVATFQKTTTVQELTLDGLRSLAETATLLARAEGLEAHARAVEVRLNGEGSLARSASEPNDKPVGLPTPSHVARLKAYESARSLWKGDGWIFMDANESPIASGVKLSLPAALNRYPDPTSDALRDAVARFYDLKRGHLLAANGSDELIDLLVRSFVRPGRKVVSLSPSYGMYRVAAESNAAELVAAPLRDDFTVDEEALLASLDGADLLFLCSPNNPTGGVLPQGLLERLSARFEGVIVVDEAYGEFADAGGVPSAIDLVRDGVANLVVLRTFSKAFGAAGIRLGYAAAHPAIIDVLLRMKPPYNVNLLTQTVGLSLWRDREQMERNVGRILAERDKLMDGCRRLGCTVYPSKANFFLMQPPLQLAAKVAYDELLASHRLVVRWFRDKPGLENCLRISVGLHEHNQLFLSFLAEMLP